MDNRDRLAMILRRALPPAMAEDERHQMDIGATAANLAVILDAAGVVFDGPGKGQEADRADIAPLIAAVL